MKATALFAAAGLALAALAFAPGANALNKKLTKKSYMDARHCLELVTNEAIIRCTERYM